MKKLVYVSAVLLATLISCTGSEVKNETKEEVVNKDKPVAPAAGVNEADWELKDVSGIVKELEIPAFSVKLPKEAKIEKDTESLTPGLLVTFPNKYELRIQFKEHALMSQDLAKVIADSKKVDTGTEDTQNKVKMVIENANGYIFTKTFTDANGKDLDEPVSHFSYYIKDKGDSYIVIDDSRFSGIVNNEGEVFSEANTKKIWDIIAGSAAFK